MGQPRFASSTSVDCRVKLAIAAIALLLLGTTLGWMAAGANTLSWDLSIARWIQRHDSPWAENLYRVGDILGTTEIIAIPVLVVLMIAIARKHHRMALFLGLSMMLRLVGTSFKPVFDSQRPSSDQVQQIQSFHGTGFPSGHSMSVAMLAGIVTLLVWRYVPNRRWRRAIVVTSALAMILVGWSRIWGGAHWPSDVLAGWSFGLAFVIIAWLLSSIADESNAISPNTGRSSATNQGK